ncbi:doubled CXXCH motif (paired_CXXCH_1) [mine drainage metagenome]|uniref:Doubled CXXCH motif (Paired_CXXCH_1) n=1 Tax=mine drainage metagenome TaxID=410659 RepID=A0A1J5Q4R8_9ZZZZ
MIHQFHMGDKLLKTGYNLNAHCNDPRDTSGLYNPAKATANSATCYNTLGLPQSVENCTTCHAGSNSVTSNKNKTTDGDNWMTKPSIIACTACHDGLTLNADGTQLTGAGTALNGLTTGHLGGAAGNADCAFCHKPGGFKDIAVAHRLAVPSQNNPVVQAGISTFQFNISNVTINASNQVVVKFQILQNGTAVALNTYAAGAVPVTGFTGGPSINIAYATGQDGIAAPADWNSGHDAATLTDLWAGANGNSLTGPDATNTYTATIASSSVGKYSSAHSLALPTDAKMVTAMMAGAFTDANANVLPGTPAMVAASGNTPDGKPNVARRVIFKEAKCNSCHDRLGTAPNFHGGNYSIAMCAACHTPNQGGSTGWSASFRVWVHGIHSASKRTVPFTWHAVSKTDNYSQLNYPGVVRDCQQCHEAGTYDFSASQYTDALVGSMLDVQATTSILNPASTTNYVFPQAAPVGSGQYAYGIAVDNTTSYGTGNSIDPATGKIVAQTNQGLNLVTSPITAVCSSCHDSASAISHFAANNGSFYQPRSVAVTKTESCLVCHGPGKVAAIADVHK